MSELGDRLNEELDQLRTVRDELRVQAHLGKLEVRELWEQAEHRWGELETKLESLRREASEPLHDVGEAARDLAQEIGKAYKRLRELV